MRLVVSARCTGQHDGPCVIAAPRGDSRQSRVQSRWDFSISYAREDRPFVRRLHEALTRDKRDSWVDWEDIPLTAEWMTEIYAGIDAADAFVFVISPDSAASETCRREIAHAVEHNKRLIPVLRRDVDAHTVPDSVSAQLGLFPRDGRLRRRRPDTDGGGEHRRRMAAYPYPFAGARHRLGNEIARSEPSATRQRLVGRGKSARIGECFATPPPTALQVQFVLLSRQAAKRRNRSIVGVATVGIFVLAALSYATWSTSRQRNIQHTRASANALVAKAQLARDSGPNLLPVSLLLSRSSHNASNLPPKRNSSSDKPCRCFPVTRAHDARERCDRRRVQPRCAPPRYRCR